tara:strand:+ start:132 stop:512 length:381 start_codon:yes stop_codon:yes gene_type:complete
MKQTEFNPEIEKAVDFYLKGSKSLIEESKEGMFNTWSLYLKKFFGYDVNNTLTQLDCDSSIVLTNDAVYRAFLCVYMSFQISTNPQPFLFCPDVQKAVIAFQYELQKIKNLEKLTDATNDIIALGD